MKANKCNPEGENMYVPDEILDRMTPSGEARAEEVFVPLAEDKETKLGFKIRNGSLFVSLWDSEAIDRHLFEEGWVRIEELETLEQFLNQAKLYPKIKRICNRNASLTRVVHRQ
jgi:hypothetical protein